MDGIIKQPRFKKVEYSRSKIIKAGKTIKKECSVTDEENALKIIDNWRAAHAFPLQVIYMHLKRMASSNSNIIVAQRLKRLDSIVNKLKREPTMSLWAIQDLGGCRFIVPSIEDVYLYSERYKKSSVRHIFKKECICRPQNRSCTDSQPNAAAPEPHPFRCLPTGSARFILIQNEPADIISDRLSIAIDHSYFRTIFLICS